MPSSRPVAAASRIASGANSRLRSGWSAPPRRYTQASGFQRLLEELGVVEARGLELAEEDVTVGRVVRRQPGRVNVAELGEPAVGEGQSIAAAGLA